MTFSCALLYNPPVDQRKKVAAAVRAYGKTRRVDGTNDGEDVGYLAKDLAADIEVGKPFILNRVNASLLFDALVAAGMKKLAKQLFTYGAAVERLSQGMAA
jgi:hypothetical protein